MNMDKFYDFFDKALKHFINKKNNATYISIGAMDGISFDDAAGHLQTSDFNIVYVEPMPKLVQILKENIEKNVIAPGIVEASAISTYDGMIDMFTVDVDMVNEEFIEKYGLQSKGYAGMSSIYPPKNGFAGTFERDIEVREKYGKTITVPCITLNTLFERHKITHFDMMSIDVEGYEHEVLSQLDFTKHRPTLIRAEIICMEEDRLNAFKDLLSKHGYVFERNGQNLDAITEEFYKEIILSTEEVVHEVVTETTPTVAMPLETNNTIENIFTSVMKFGGNKQLLLRWLESTKQLVESFSEESQQGQLPSISEFALSPELEVTENLTVVTGLWNINRPGRDFSFYIENFKKFLEFPVNLFVYVPKELEYLVWENPLRTKQNTYVRIVELDDIKNNYYGPFWENTQKIRTSSEWMNKTGEQGWLRSSPQASLEYYNPIVQSKMFMLHDAKILNPFNTDYLMWLDAGITNTVYEKYFTDNKCLDKIIPHLQTFLFLSYPYEAVDEIHGFDIKEMNKLARQKVSYVCRGGLFGGHKDYISIANSTYYHLLESSLANGYMGTEESIFSIMAHLDPAIYKRYALDDNGLVVKFVQALLDDSVTLEGLGIRQYNAPKGIYVPHTTKTSLYVLGFNFPEQFRTLLHSFSHHPEWLARPRKILINNSDNQKNIDEYEALCKEYGFEHIVTGKNLGINGGRLLAAKHFDESDSDYYLFFEDDMCLHKPTNVGVCRNGFRLHVPNLYDKIHHIMAREEFDFLKLSFTEVYMDNNIQVSWYNVPQYIRTHLWPEYDQLPVSGLDTFSPRTKFNKIDSYDGLSYIDGDIYYANWPMIVSRKGNYKMFLETKWEHPYEQTWMSYMFQETLKGNIHPAILLASPINHNRIAHYQLSERREN